MKLKNVQAGQSIEAKTQFGVGSSNIVKGYAAADPNTSYTCPAGTIAKVIRIEGDVIIAEAYAVIFKTHAHLWRKVVDNPVT